MTDGPDDKTTALTVPPQPPAGKADTRPRVALVGAGELARELAIALGRLGARVIALDERADAPAHAVADQSLVVAMTDADELTKAIRGLQPDFVVTTTDAVAAQALEGLEGPQLVPSAHAVRLAADREGLRRLAADELGLPTAPFWFVGSAGELEAVGAHAGYPLLVQPVLAGAGRGQSVASGPDDIGPAWQRATRGHGEQHRVLAETVVEVEFYVTLLAVRSDGPQGPRIDFCSPVGHPEPTPDVLESWQPQSMTAAAMDAAKSIAARIVKALGGRGVFAVELMINGDEVYFVDVTPRPTDSAWATVPSQRLSAFELQARTVLGLPVDTIMISPGAAHRVERADAPPVAIAGALGVPESDLRLAGRAFQALATAPDVTAARDRARDVADRLAVRHQGPHSSVTREARL
ncbi:MULTISPECIES: formate-dependent phosphoribosylglycinamide formyltransferase [unclassified Mycobacterium]|uniref:formate-dependent phosphoribosylglycinamide formyltransferase n=1 Tax=unclassified Mycobacterium TaxID=2642494 RepID=UPI0007FF27B0|nr:MULTISPECIES: formate-dependent phosphoribosylglycinamide formyltransferase [unclassified Mycobacterium]OBG62893.1 phosphoribosylglycinamide formyltransferase 2 [Mycobacterium sp. E735]OBG69252.1 phosphoribosylglycinamide formyltransferase 2 [Mycobacterium sp. E3298]OBG70826.1 phosphoribosylglycinamide formyltransferase 2 [Mycobacterium sp. E3305]OBH10517.1 phosphoribosylglycinamide formyltransferase 2 [Mycobacterium sp. E1715]